MSDPAYKALLRRVVEGGKLDKDQSATVFGAIMDGKVHEAGIAEGIFAPVYGATINQATKDSVAAAIKDVTAGKTKLTDLIVKK